MQNNSYSSDIAIGRRASALYKSRLFTALSTSSTTFTSIIELVFKDLFCCCKEPILKKKYSPSSNMPEVNDYPDYDEFKVPALYTITNKSSGTVLDLYYGKPDAGTAINGL